MFWLNIKKISPLICLPLHSSTSWSHACPVHPTMQPEHWGTPVADRHTTLGLQGPTHVIPAGQVGVLDLSTQGLSLSQLAPRN